MAHLKKAASGHLLKSSGGHLVNDCGGASETCPSSCASCNSNYTVSMSGIGCQGLTTQYLDLGAADGDGDCPPTGTYSWLGGTVTVSTGQVGSESCSNDGCAGAQFNGTWFLSRTNCQWDSAGVGDCDTVMYIHCNASGHWELVVYVS
jgi:hypothetical protein